MPNYSLEKILNPQSIAVVGANPNLGRGPNFALSLADLGFKGKIHPVNPHYSDIRGLKTYPSVKDIPGTVDYAICAIPAPAVPNMLDECGQKGVKLVQIFTGRFGETGRKEGVELEQEVLKRARKWGIRLIGPNCMGIYNPRLGMGWDDEFPTESGTVGLASQSSYAAHDFILAALPRGIRFSKVVTFGNALDLNECDFLEYLSQDTETRIILMYVEGVRDGPRFSRSLRKAAAAKPVIIIKGGRGAAGTRAAASHTSSLAGSLKVWKAALAQAGAMSVESFDEMLDLAVSFRFLPPIKGRRTVITASGGGPGVNAADQCEEEGLEVISLPSNIRGTLKTREIPIWDWISNPIDLSITHGIMSATDLMGMMRKNTNFDLLIAIMGEPHYLRHQQEITADSYLEPYQLQSSGQLPLLAVVPEKNPDVDHCEEPGYGLLGEIRAKLIAAGVPAYPNIGRAARAARKLIDYYS